MADRRVQLILEAQDRASGVIDDVGDSLRGVELDLKKVTLAAAGIVGALTGAGILVGKAAIDAEVPWSRLDRQLENAGYNSKALRGEIEATARSLQDLTRFADGDTAKVLTDLVAITEDYRGSLKNIELVYDLAIGKNLDLSTSAQIVGRVMEGNTEILKRYGIEVKAGADGVQALRQRFGGFARSDAKEVTGALVQIKNDLDTLLETFGKGLVKGSDFAKGVAWVREELKKATEWVEANQDKIEQWGRDVRDAIIWVIDMAKATAEWAREHKELLITLGTTAVVVQLTSSLVDLAGAFGDAAKGAKVLMALETAGPLLKLLPHVTSLKDVTTLLTWAFQGLAGVLVANGPVLLGLAAVGALIYDGAKRAKEAKEEVQNYRKELVGLTRDQAQAEFARLAAEKKRLDADYKDAKDRFNAAAEFERFNRSELPSHGMRKATKEVSDLKAQIDSLDRKIIEAATHLTQLMAGEPPTDPGSGAGKKKGFALPELGPAQLTMNGRPAVFTGWTPKLQFGRDLLEAQRVLSEGGELPKAFQQNRKPEFGLPAGHSRVIKQFQQMREEERKTVQATLEFQRAIDQAIGISLVQTFEAFGGALVNSFSDIDGAFKGLLGSVSGLLGDIMITAGTQIVLTSTAFEKFKASLFTLVPGGGIAAGLTLIAAGAAFKAGAHAFLSNPTGGGGAAGGSMGSYADTLGAGRSGDGPVTLKIEGGILDMSDPRQEDALRRALERLTGRRVIVEGRA